MNVPLKTEIKTLKLEKKKTRKEKTRNLEVGSPELE